MKSWRTTLAGWVAGLAILFGQAGAVLDDDPETQLSVELIMAAVALIGGGTLARDNNVSSEKAGAK